MVNYRFELRVEHAVQERVQEREVSFIFNAAVIVSQIHQFGMFVKLPAKPFDFEEVFGHGAVNVAPNNMSTVEAFVANTTFSSMEHEVAPPSYCSGSRLTISNEQGTIRFPWCFAAGIVNVVGKDSAALENLDLFLLQPLFDMDSATWETPLELFKGIILGFWLVQVL